MCLNSTQSTPARFPRNFTHSRVLINYLQKLRKFESFLFLGPSIRLNEEVKWWWWCVDVRWDQGFGMAQVAVASSSLLEGESGGGGGEGGAGVKRGEARSALLT
ncbi:hypothetical protein Droror1_Dr00027063, partial [Drosera rotundifolia]